MVERRDFLKAAIVTVSALTLGPGSKVSASEGGAPFTNVIYTEGNPGKWAGKAKTHAPMVDVAAGKVSVKTTHPMSVEHYIVRHTLVLGDGTVVGGVTFKPNDPAESSYDLPPGYKGKVYATSFCNLHDFWLTEFMV